MQCCVAQASDRWILHTTQSQEGPVGKEKLRWWCLGWLQTNAGLCTSVWPSHHYRGNRHRRCVFSFAKNAFLLGRPEEWNWVILLRLRFERWGKFGASEGKVHPLKKQTFFHSCWFVLFPSWHGRKKLSWLPFELSGEEQSRCYIESLKLFVQVDIGFFGVKVSQSPPGSQGLHCAALGRLERWFYVVWDSPCSCLKWRDCLWMCGLAAIKILLGFAGKLLNGEKSFDMLYLNPQFQYPCYCIFHPSTSSLLKSHSFIFWNRPKSVCKRRTTIW